MSNDITLYAGRYLSLLERDGWEFASRSNASGVVVLVPVTGQTLPLVSMGGSSIFFTSMATGMILSVSWGTRVESEQESQKSKEENGQPEELSREPQPKDLTRQRKNNAKNDKSVAGKATVATKGAEDLVKKSRTNKHSDDQKVEFEVNE